MGHNGFCDLHNKQIDLYISHMDFEQWLFHVNSKALVRGWGRKGDMKTITNYRADSGFQQSCSARPSNASRVCRKLESNVESNIYYLSTPSFVLGKYPPHAHNVSLMKSLKEISPSNQTEVSIHTKDLEMSEKSGFYDSSKLIAFSEIPKTSSQDC
jgi:hypothetical protein